MSSYCRTCRAELPAQARFCGKCGTASRSHARSVVARGQQERSEVLRAALAFGWVCVGTFVAMLVVASFVGDQDPWSSVLWDAAGMAMVGLCAAGIRGSWRESMPLGLSWQWLVAAGIGAAMSMVFGIAYVGVLSGGHREPSELPGTPVIVAVAVLAPLFEEWLCRGVAWRAAAAMANPQAAWLLTSILFAFLHGLGGNYLLELPHRAFAGLVFGWLRWRSGSLVPGVVAHALHNAAAVLQFGG